MNLLVSVLIGTGVGVGVYLITSAQALRIVIGLAVIGNSVNLALLALGGLTKGSLPIMKDTEQVLSSQSPDPLPQALILTAIVIGFGMQAFALTLLYKSKVEKNEDTL